jgi:hypothetical protein
MGVLKDVHSGSRARAESAVVASLDRKRLGGRLRGRSGISVRGVFDKETRRKPLAFAADAVRYGISTAAWI